MKIRLKRYYALLSPGHILLFAVLALLAVLVIVLSLLQNGTIDLALECCLLGLIFAALFLPLSYSSELQVDESGAILFDCGGTVSLLRLAMRHAVKRGYRLTSVSNFRFEQSALEKRAGVGRLILSGVGEIVCLDGHTENESIRERVFYGIPDFENFKQSFVDFLNSNV